VPNQTISLPQKNPACLQQTGFRFILNFVVGLQRVGAGAEIFVVLFRDYIFALLGDDKFGD